jgi:Sulfotransferase domain
MVTPSTTHAPGRLPDFLGVGPPRTATSWLDAALRGHAAMPREIKEVDFFVKNYARGIDWYRSYFRDADPALPAGEICPSYFGPPEVRERVKLHLPNCKIICTIRDPVESLYSQCLDTHRYRIFCCQRMGQRPRRRPARVARDVRG